jgi:hypothetical protein
MKSRIVRSFGLLDAMIIVAAIAAFFAVSRGTMLWPNDPNDFPFWQRLGRRWGVLLMFLSAAMIVVRLRSPRPRWRRVWCQPGFTACVAALIGAAANAGATALGLHARLSLPEYYTIAQVCESWSYAGPAVLGTWLALLLNRRWRAERGAIDRLGRLIGLLWIIELAFSEMPGSRWFLVLDRYIWKHWR